MNKKQVIVLALCYFVVFTGLSAVVGVMPLYLKDLGQDETFTGFFLAAAYASLAISTVVAGRLSDLLRRRTPLLIVGGGLCAPIVWLMAQTTDVTALLLLMAAHLFAMGLVTSMVSILTGLFSDAGNRGRLFGLLNLSVGVGLMFGGFVSGWIVDRWDYTTLFQLLALFYLIVPMAGWFAQDKHMETDQDSARMPMLQLLMNNRAFLLLFFASILSQAANTLIFLARPLMMDALSFDVTTITSAAAIGSLVTLPFPLIIGWLADHFGHKSVIIACFLGPILGLLAMAGATELWHFWAASVLQTIVGVSVVVGSAYITDTFPENSLGTALSLLNSTPWIGIVIGLSAGGVALKTLQAAPTLLIGAGISFVALLLLLPMSMRKAKSNQVVGARHTPPAVSEMTC